MPTDSEKGSTGSPCRATTAIRQASTASVTGKIATKNTRDNSEDPLVLLGGYLRGLVDFTNKTRNAHLEVKEGVKNAYKTFLMVQEKYTGAGTKLPPSSLEDKQTAEPNKVVGMIEAIVKHTEERILGAIDKARASAKPEPLPPTQAAAWSDVVKRKTNKESNQPLKLNGETRDLVVREKLGAKRRNRPPAILVNVGNNSFTDTLRRIKTNETVRKLTEDINSLTKTKQGDILVQLRNGSASTASITKAIGEAIGEPDKAKQLIQYDKIVVQDLDELADEAEVVESIAEATGVDTDKIRILSNFSMPRGTRWMVASLAPGIINNLLKKGKIRVGYVLCRIKQWEQRRMGRCPRCLVDGHLVRDCQGPDRRKNCRACGEVGHHQAKCEADATKREEFRAVISKEKDRSAVPTIPK